MNRQKPGFGRLFLNAIVGTAVAVVVAVQTYKASFLVALISAVITLAIFGVIYFSIKKK